MVSWVILLIASPCTHYWTQRSKELATPSELHPTYQVTDLPLYANRVLIEQKTQLLSNIAHLLRRGHVRS